MLTINMEQWGEGWAKQECQLDGEEQPGNCCFMYLVS